MNSNPMVPEAAADPAAQDGAGRAIEPGAVPQPQAPEPLTAQRNAFMAVFGVAETIMSTSPVLPSSVQVYCMPWDVAGARVEPYFHLAPGDVQAFAEHFGGSVSESVYESGSVHTEACGVVDGVPFRAWALMPAPVSVTAVAKQDPAASGDQGLVTRYRAGDGQEFLHTGERTEAGLPLYAEARVDLPTQHQATADELRAAFGDLAVIETAPLAESEAA